jgi:hypothetical protein
MSCTKQTWEMPLVLLVLLLQGMSMYSIEATSVGSFLIATRMLSQKTGQTI